MIPKKEDTKDEAMEENACEEEDTSRVKGEYSPYSIYYGQKLHLPCTFAMGETVKIAKTEYGIQVANKVLQKIKNFYHYSKHNKTH